PGGDGVVGGRVGVGGRGRTPFGRAGGAAARRAHPVTTGLSGAPRRIPPDALPGSIAPRRLPPGLAPAAPRSAGPVAADAAAERERRRYEQACRGLLEAEKSLPLRRLLGLREYPPEVMALYAEGYTLTRFLVKHRDRATFLAFVELGRRKDWDTAVRRYYG